MVTTIQLSNKTKIKLDKIKKTKKISYDQIVSDLLKHEEKLLLKEEIANYYSVYADEDLEEVNEWIHTEVNK
jgi:hypothetical protein